MIGILLLIGCASLALVTLGAYFYMQKCVEWFLTKDTDDLEYILDVEGVPPRWCIKRARRIERLRNKGASENRIERAKKRADRYFQKKMKRIVSFAKAAPVFESENHRQVALEDLERIKEQWKRREFMHEPY